MFPYQQMAVPMMPRADLVLAPWCRACTGTCYDTGHWGCGFSCDLFSGGCGGGTIRYPQAQVQDLSRALQELRESLELTLAGVNAQERMLHERQSGTQTEAAGQDQKK